MPIVRIVGPGRAGSSLADALNGVGWAVAPSVSRHDDPSQAAHGVDLCVISTPDDEIAKAANAIEPDNDTVVAHMSGSHALDVLAPHTKTASMHPLASLPDRETGSQTLTKGIWWAVEGNDLVEKVVADLGGRTITPTDRVAYHAAACIAANHLVALMAQVERVASQAGVSKEPFYDLAAQALANARAHGARDALTGPAKRGDEATIRRHLDALHPDEHELYEAGARACR